MRKIAPVHRKKDIISKNILERKDVTWQRGKPLSKRRNGSFSERSSLKERLQKSALYAEDQDILQKNCPKNEKAAKLLEQAKIHADDTPFSDVESLLP